MLPNVSVETAANALHVCKAWQLPLYAHLSHVSASRDGKAILATTSTERRNPITGSAYPARVRFLNKSGKVVWSHGLAHPVRAQDLAPDGSLAVVNTYEGMLFVYDGRGKKLWQAEHIGRPVIFSKTKRIIELNDDDAEPDTAFTVYDFHGKVLATVKMPNGVEAIDMFTAEDESQIIVTGANDKFYGYGADGKLLWQESLKGGAVSTVSAELDGLKKVFVLGSAGKGSQMLSAFEVGGDQTLVARWKKTLDRRYESLRLVGDVLFLYGNSHLGQSLAGHSTATGDQLWQRSYSIPATYSSLVLSLKDFSAVAVDKGAVVGQLHVLGIQSSGMAIWEAAVSAGDGIYSFAVARDKLALTVGTGEPGNGVLEHFAIGDKPCSK